MTSRDPVTSLLRICAPTFGFANGKNQIVGFLLTRYITDPIHKNVFHLINREGDAVRIMICDMEGTKDLIEKFLLINDNKQGAGCCPTCPTSLQTAGGVGMDCCCHA